MVAECLNGNVTLVIGGATGIGRVVVEKFLSEGCLVSVLDIKNPIKLNDTEAARMNLIIGDATSPNEVTEAVESTVTRFGSLDTLICCAGRFDFHTPISALTIDKLSDAFDEIYSINVKSMLLAVRAALSELRKSRGSVILTLSSSAFYPEGGGVLYGSSKWATRGLVAHLARELAPEVRVNGVAPGGTVGTSLRGIRAIDEERTVELDPKRESKLRAENLLQIAATPEYHAGAYLYLASSALSQFVTGAVINSDGGRGSHLGIRKFENEAEDKYV